MEFLAFSGVLALLALVVLYAGVKIVPQGDRWTVERFGRYTRTLEPGLRIIVPFVDRVGRRLTVMEQVLDVPQQTVITADNASVRADGVVFFRIDDASHAAYQVRNLQEAIVNLTTTNLRSVIGSMSLDDTLSKRNEINDQLMSIVDEATNPWGIKVVRIEIRDLQLPQDLQNAMNMQMTAERKRRATVTEAEGEREAEVLRAEGKKKAAFLEADAREREAEAEANATQIVSKAIREGDMNAINYFVSLEYVKALQAIGQSENSKLVMMPLEASSITGAVSGIGELIKHSGFGQTGAK